MVKSDALMHDGHVELLDMEAARADDYRLWKY